MHCINIFHFLRIIMRSSGLWTACFILFMAASASTFWGLWAYYLSSPLNLIIVLFPKEMLNMVLSHLYIIKIALCRAECGVLFQIQR